MILNLLFPFSLIYTDVWGPSRIPNINGAHWFVFFIDDYFGVTWLFLLKNKFDMSFVFLVFHKMISI